MALPRINSTLSAKPAKDSRSYEDYYERWSTELKGHAHTLTNQKKTIEEAIEKAKADKTPKGEATLLELKKIEFSLNRRLEEMQKIQAAIAYFLLDAEAEPQKTLFYFRKDLQNYLSTLTAGTVELDSLATINPILLSSIKGAIKEERRAAQERLSDLDRINHDMGEGSYEAEYQRNLENPKREFTTEELLVMDYSSLQNTTAFTHVLREIEPDINQLNDEAEMGINYVTGETGKEVKAAFDKAGFGGKQWDIFSSEEEFYQDSIQKMFDPISALTDHKTTSTQESGILTPEGRTRHLRQNAGHSELSLWERLKQRKFDIRDKAVREEMIKELLRDHKSSGAVKAFKENLKEARRHLENQKAVVDKLIKSGKLKDKELATIQALHARIASNSATLENTYRTLIQHTDDDGERLHAAEEARNKLLAALERLHEVQSAWHGETTPASLVRDRLLALLPDLNDLRKESLDLICQGLTDLLKGTQARATAETLGLRNAMLPLHHLSEDKLIVQLPAILEQANIEAGEVEATLISQLRFAKKQVAVERDPQTLVNLKKEIAAYDEGLTHIHAIQKCLNKLKKEANLPSPDQEKMAAALATLRGLLPQRTLEGSLVYEAVQHLDDFRSNLNPLLNGVNDVVIQQARILASMAVIPKLQEQGRAKLSSIFSDPISRYNKAETDALNAVKNFNEPLSLALQYGGEEAKGYASSEISDRTAGVMLSPLDTDKKFDDKKDLGQWWGEAGFFDNIGSPQWQENFTNSLIQWIIAQLLNNVIPAAIPIAVGLICPPAAPIAAIIVNIAVNAAKNAKDVEELIAMVKKELESDKRQKIFIDKIETTMTEQAAAVTQPLSTGAKNAVNFAALTGGPVPEVLRLKQDTPVATAKTEATPAATAQETASPTDTDKPRFYQRAKAGLSRVAKWIRDNPIKSLLAALLVMTTGGAGVAASHVHLAAMHSSTTILEALVGGGLAAGFGIGRRKKHNAAEQPGVEMNQVPTPTAVPQPDATTVTPATASVTMFNRSPSGGPSGPGKGKTAA